MKATIFLLASAAAVSISKKSREAPSEGFKVDVKSFSQKGAGASCKDSDTVTAHYTGKLTNGQVFDSSVQGLAPEPFKFVLGQGEVIKCWDQGFFGMQPGEKATITCPSDMAYGDEAQEKIPAGSTLLFDVEVLNCETSF